MNAQLPLALRWPAQQRFELFVPGENGVAPALLRNAALDRAAPWVFVSGAGGSGKTHLLLAACAAASDSGRSAQYLSLRRREEPGASPASADPVAAARQDGAAALRALGGSDVLALDDVESIGGDGAAEHALFDLYNRCKVDKSTMLFGAAGAPARIGIALPDLVSRLSACAQVALKPLGDAERREVLRQRAQLRGLTLDDAVLDWLFARSQRDLGSLTALLDRIDREALAAQRRITVPFLRQLLDGDTPRPA